MGSIGEEAAALMAWLNTFEDVEARTLEELSSGLVIHDVLAKIGPGTFTEDTVKRDINPDNWVMKEGNIRGIMNGLDMAYRELVGVNMSGPLSELDSEGVAKATSEADMVALLELVLGLAVQCEAKQQYVSGIVAMDKAVQVVLMKVIKRLMEQSRRLSGAGTDGPSLAAQQQAQAQEQEQGAGQAGSGRPAGGSSSGGANDAASSQRVFELENMVADLKDELARAQKESEAAQLRARDARHAAEELELVKDQTNEALSAAQTRVAELEAKVKAEATAAQEVLKSETARAQEQILAADNKASKAETALREKTSEVEALTAKLAASRETEDAFHQLKDEVDTLRSSALKADKLERQLTKYKERIAGLADMKKQMDDLQTENDRNVQKLGEMTNKAARVAHLESQITDYREQVTGLESRVRTLEMEKDRAEAKLAKAKDQVAEAQHEIDLLKSSGSRAATADDADMDAPGPDSAMATSTSDLFTADLQARLRKVEEENKMLKAAAAGAASGDTDAALESVQEVLERVQLSRDTLQDELTAATKKLHAAEDTIEDLEGKLAKASSANLESELDTDKARLALESLAKAQRSLESKDAELAELSKESAELKRELGTTKEALSLSQQNVVNLESKLSLVGSDQEDMLAALREQATQEKEQALAAERSAAATQIEDLKLETETAVAEAAAAATALAEAQAAAASASAAAEEATAEAKAAAADLNEALKATADAKEELYAAKEAVAAKDTELSAERAALAKLQGKIELLEHTTSVSAGSSEEAAALRTKNTELLERVHALELELSSASAATTAEQVRVEALNEKLAAASSKIANFESLVNELRSSASSAAAAAGAPAEAVASLNAQIAQLKAEITDKTKEVAFFKSQFQESKVVFTRENQLLTTAFYNLGLELQRLKSQARVTGGAGASDPVSSRGSQGWINDKRSARRR